MNILFDTQAFLWFTQGSSNFSPLAQREIENTDNKLFFSAASYWEICIKFSIGKLKLDHNWQQMMERELSYSGIKWLDIQKKHLNHTIILPWHHKDPFDRLIIAQAIQEDLTVVTSDKAFKLYKVNIVHL